MAKFEAMLDACDISQSPTMSAGDHLIPLKSETRRSSLPRQDLVARAIASAVIPGLLASSRSAIAPVVVQPQTQRPVKAEFSQFEALWDDERAAAQFLPHEVERFAEQTLDGDADAAGDYVCELCAMGLTPIDVMLGLMTPAIRLLGAWWVTDKRSFMDVTVGSIRLQQAMRRMMDIHAPPVAAQPDAPVCLFTVAPLEQHTFGVQVLDNIFRLEGWQMVTPDSHDEGDVLMTVAMTHIDVIGLSAATDGGLARLAPFIATLRRSSANRAVKIMVGGPAFQPKAARQEQPAMIEDLVADAVAYDARGALETSAKLIGI
jgi:MerR family transcriptional regulator, light-induced transcriptional regulator